ncbi:TonB-dependent receptor [Parabacteroides sp. Marseille-P3160]|uniref:SusC/RagA family TonB-linked outer membrane protein n=1 Tax=Parabacteroides sp. Marseille-P3160 TaxID=1917887 RepID=UPI0009B9ECCF|nr:TonB-dependent receptor [Parabacteroides sp. Marseille-P3160]
MKNKPKILRIMKFSTCLFFLCIFTSFAENSNSQNAKVNIITNNLTIGDFIDQVEKQTDYLFVYSKSEVNIDDAIAVNSGKKPVNQFLNEAFTQSGINYSFENDYIVLTKKAAPSIVQQQGRKITGIITDSNGDPVIGANVLIRGTTNGSITDINGNYTLERVTPDAILQVSYIGYLTQEIPVGNQTQINVTLIEDSKTLEEVVVVGYGTMRKSDVTGSIAVAKGEDLLKSQNFSALDNLRGKASGVNIYSNSSQPGTYANRVVIRGMSTINSSSNPLYVVDGVVMEDFHLLNPNDIESIEVLKDASAAAIYGARGANGVILVTTKRGNKGEGTSVSYQGSISLSTVSRYMDLLNAQEWTDAFMIGLENENKYQGKSWSLNRADWFTDRNYFDANGNPLYDTDWQKEATRIAISHNHQLNIQQGGKNSSVGAFLNYTDQQGILNNTYNKRVNAKLAYDAKPLPWLSTAINLLVNHTWGRYTPEDGGGQEARRTMIEMLPWLPVRDANGKYTTSSSSSMAETFGFEGMSNPVMILDLQKRMRYNTQIFGNAALTFHLLDGLDLKTQLGIDNHQRTYKGYSSVSLNNISMPNGWAEINHTNTLYWQEETYLTYNKVFDEHRINAMAGLSWQERTYNYDRSRTEGFDDDFYEYNNLGVGTTPSSPESDWNSWAMNSYFLRLAYTYKDRYSATVTGRYDGSSKFGENNKYAFFPSAGLAWIASNEDFLSNNELISTLKLHTSYGLTGNSEIDPYQSLASVSAGTWLLDGTRSPYSYISSMANPDLKWEKTAQWDIGFNLGLFDNRLNFDIAYYHKKTTDLLLESPLPTSTGFDWVLKNIGSVQNQGLDIMIDGTPVQTKDFTWTSTLNMNYNKNKVLSLGENDEDILLNSWVGGYESIIRVGENMNSFYGYKRYGVYTTEDYEAGDCTLNQVGRAKRSADKEILGKGTPDWTGSFINNFRYKNFDLTIDMQFVWGVETMQQFYHSTYDRFGITNGLSNILYDAYDGTNPNTMQQAIYLTNSGHAGQDTTVDSAWIVDGSYLRVNLIQLGYTFAPKQCKAIGISGLRVYGNANNPFLICSGDFNGYDPESTSQYGDSEKFGQNMTFFSYPRATTFTLGVNVTF